MIYFFNVNCIKIVQRRQKTVALRGVPHRCTVVSRDVIESVLAVRFGQQEPDRCPCECVSVLRSREHPQRLHNEREG